MCYASLKYLHRDKQMHLRSIPDHSHFTCSCIFLFQFTCSHPFNLIHHYSQISLRYLLTRNYRVSTEWVLTDCSLRMIGGFYKPVKTTNTGCGKMKFTYRNINPEIQLKRWTEHSNNHPANNSNLKPWGHERNLESPEALISKQENNSRAAGKK